MILVEFIEELVKTANDMFIVLGSWVSYGAGILSGIVLAGVTLSIDYVRGDNAAFYWLRRKFAELKDV